MTKSYRKIDWDVIKNKWLNEGYSPRDIMREFDLSSAHVYPKIKKWLSDGAIPSDTAKNEKVSLRDIAFTDLWGKLDEYELSEPEKIFVINYAHTNNAETSLKDSGLTGKSKSESRATLTYLMSKKKLQLALRYVRGLILNKYNLDQEDVVGHFAKILNSSMGDFIDDYGYKQVTVTTRKGTYQKEVPYIQMKKITDVDMSLVKSIKVGQSGDVQIELYDKKLALEFFTKYLNLIEDKQESNTESKLAQGLLGLAEIFKNK